MVLAWYGFSLCCCVSLFYGDSLCYNTINGVSLFCVFPCYGASLSYGVSLSYVLPHVIV